MRSQSVVRGASKSIEGSVGGRNRCSTALYATRLVTAFRDRAWRTVEEQVAGGVCCGWRWAWCKVCDERCMKHGNSVQTGGQRNVCTASWQCT